MRSNDCMSECMSFSVSGWGGGPVEGAMASRSPAQSTLRLHVGSGGWRHLVEFVFQTIQHPPGCRERVVAGHGVRWTPGDPVRVSALPGRFPDAPSGPGRRQFHVGNRPQTSPCHLALP